MHTRTTLDPDYTWEVVTDGGYEIFRTEQEAREHQRNHGGRFQRHFEGEGIAIESWAELCRQLEIIGREKE